MSVAALLHRHEGFSPRHAPKVRWSVWLPALLLALTAHGAAWLAYREWQAEQVMPRPLPAVQIALLSAPAPRVEQPPPRPAAPPRQSPAVAKAPAAPTPAATESLADTEPDAAVEPVSAVDNADASPAAVQPEITQPIYNAAYLNNPPPAYPLAARRRGIEGTVVVRAQILENGNCRQANLSKSSGHAMLDAAAVAAVRSWRFAPARRGTEAITAWVEVPITFRLSHHNEQIQAL